MQIDPRDVLVPPGSHDDRMKGRLMSSSHRAPAAPRRLHSNQKRAYKSVSYTRTSERGDRPDARSYPPAWGWRLLLMRIR